MQTEPLVSVVIPVYNAEKFISEALNSICNQTYRNLQIIVINDSSKDSSLQIINDLAQKDARIIVATNPVNLKAAGTLNEAIKKCTGKYVARMDADDWSYPERIQKQVEFMENNPDVGLLGASMEVCSKFLIPQSTRYYPESDAKIREIIFRYNPFCSPLTFMRKEILDKAGYFDITFPPVEDYELYFRLGLYSQFANLPDILLKYRLSENSLTQSSTRKMELKTFLVRKKYFLKYKMTIIDITWNIVQLFTMLIVPAKYRMKLFYYFRDKRKHDSKNSSHSK